MPQLRPIERVIANGLAEGIPVTEIAASLRKSPGTVERIARMVDFIESTGLERDFSRTTNDRLRPIERRVTQLRSEGVSVGEIAARLRRSGNYVRRVEQFAEFKTTGSWST